MSKKSMGYTWIAYDDSSKPFKSWSSILGATMERSIPHIRSIFSTPSQRKKSASSDTQDLCQYDKSPRNNRQRRPKDPPTDYSALDPAPKQQQAPPSSNKSRPNKENLKNGNYNTYTSKTLTEKDMRHLERHLSMKKTIRKQISRNLAQAFLDNPDIFEPEDYSANVKPSEVHRGDHQLPNSEQNVLDLLKVSIEDRDSGHSSPTHEVLEDTDVEEDDQEGWRSRGHRDSETKGLVDDRSKQEIVEKKSSIWRMFSSRNKTKR